MAGYDLATNRIYGHVKVRKGRTEFLAFMRYLRSLHPPEVRIALEEYGITYPPKQRSALGACDVPMAQALDGKAIDVAELCSTQPAISQFGFVSLEDDLAHEVVVPVEMVTMDRARDDVLGHLGAWLSILRHGRHA